MLDYEEELKNSSQVLKWMILKMRFIRKILTDMTDLLKQVMDQKKIER